MVSSPTSCDAVPPHTPNPQPLVPRHPTSPLTRGAPASPSRVAPFPSPCILLRNKVQKTFLHSCHAPLSLSVSPFLPPSLSHSVPNSTFHLHIFFPIASFPSVFNYLLPSLSATLLKEGFRLKFSDSIHSSTDCKLASSTTTHWQLLRGPGMQQ